MKYNTIEEYNSLILANAIIVQTARDYRNALIKNNIKMIKECEEFFTSDRICTMTELDPLDIMNRIKEETLSKITQ